MLNARRIGFVFSIAIAVISTPDYACCDDRPVRLERPIPEKTAPKDIEPYVLPIPVMTEFLPSAIMPVALERQVERPITPWDELPPPEPDGRRPSLGPPGREERGDSRYLNQTGLSADYIYYGRASVDEPSTPVSMSEVALAYQARLPLRDRATLSIRPFADVLFLSGPGGPEPILPPQLYKTAVDLQLDFQLTTVFGLSAGFTPGFWTDFDRVSTRDVRLPFRLLGAAQISDSLLIAGGVLYTDNIRRNVLPLIGVIWDATDRIRAELLFPRGRILYRLRDALQLYVAAERGGDTYNISTTQFDEDMEYRDVRLSVGVQAEFFQRFTGFVEGGVAVARKFRFDFQPERDVNTTYFVRTGIRF